MTTTRAAAGGRPELLLAVSAVEDADREEMENVIGARLSRLRTRDGLSVGWTR